jgi:hypothetical protein
MALDYLSPPPEQLPPLPKHLQWQQNAQPLPNHQERIKSGRQQILYLIRIVIGLRREIE